MIRLPHQIYFNYINTKIRYKKLYSLKFPSSSMRTTSQSITRAIINTLTKSTITALQIIHRTLTRAKVPFSKFGLKIQWSYFLILRVWTLKPDISNFISHKYMFLLTSVLKITFIWRVPSSTHNWSMPNKMANMVAKSKIIFLTNWEHICNFLKKYYVEQLIRNHRHYATNYISVVLLWCYTFNNTFYVS